MWSTSLKVQVTHSCGNWKWVTCLVKMRIGQNTKFDAMFLFYSREVLLLLTSKGHTTAAHIVDDDWGEAVSPHPFIITQNNTHNCSSHKNLHSRPRINIKLPIHCVRHTSTYFQNTYTGEASENPFQDELPHGTLYHMQYIHSNNATRWL